MSRERQTYGTPEIAKEVKLLDRIAAKMRAKDTGSLNTPVEQFERWADMLAQLHHNEFNHEHPDERVEL